MICEDEQFIEEQVKDMKFYVYDGVFKNNTGVKGMIHLFPKSSKIHLSESNKFYDLYVTLYIDIQCLMQPKGYNRPLYFDFETGDDKVIFFHRRNNRTKLPMIEATFKDNFYELRFLEEVDVIDTVDVRGFVGPYDLAKSIYEDID